MNVRDFSHHAWECELKLECVIFTLNVWDLRGLDKVTLKCNLKLTLKVNFSTWTQFKTEVKTELQFKLKLGLIWTIQF